MYRTASVYFAYFLRFIQSRMEYKVDFLSGIFANMLSTVSGLLFVIFLIDGKTVTGLRGWKLEEVLFIYGYSMLGMAFFNTIARNLYRFGDKYIIQGQFDRVLLRPLNSLMQVLFESFNLDAVGMLLMGVGVIIYASAELQLIWTPLDFIWLLLSSVCAGTILLAVFVFLCSLSFHFEDRLGITAPVYNLINFARYPLPIFNRTIQIILSWVVPFAFVAFFPATHFLGRSEFYFFCYLTPVIAVVSSSIAYVAWQFGVSRYESTGN